MNDFIQYLIIGSLWCFGFWKLWDDLLLPLRTKIELAIGIKWTKPLFNCPPCMSSIHGLLLHWVLWYGEFSAVTWFNFWHMAVYCFALCGLNYIVLQSLPEYD